MRRFIYIWVSMIITTPAFAASSVTHSLVTVDRDGNITEFSEISADSDGNLRMDSFSPQYEAVSMSDAAAAVGSAAPPKAHRGGISDSVIYQASEDQIVAVDGDRCQVLNSDTPAPFGMQGGMQGVDMSQYQEAMKQAQSQMDNAFAEMAKENPEAAAQMKQQYGGLVGLGSAVNKQPQFELVETGQTQSFGNYRTTVFDLVETSENRKDQTVWAADIDSVEGGDLVSNGMLGMYGVYQAYMESMGLNDMAGAGMLGVIMEKMRDYYPVVTIDHTDGSRTELRGINESSDVNYFPACG